MCLTLAGPQDASRQRGYNALLAVPGLPADLHLGATGHAAQAGGDVARPAQLPHRTVLLPRRILRGRPSTEKCPLDRRCATGNAALIAVPTGLMFFGLWPPT